MPTNSGNPFTMIATGDARARWKAEANWGQRAIFRQGGEKIITLTKTIGAEASGERPIKKGTYEVTYEYNSGGGWVKGAKVQLNHSGFVQFDDGPAGTPDGDFNDFQVWFDY